MRSLFGRFWETQFITIECKKNLDDSIESLSNGLDSVLRGYFTPFEVHQRFVGSATREVVEAVRVLPLFEVFWKPRFEGCFKEIDGRLFLVGEIRYRGCGLMVVSCLSLGVCFLFMLTLWLNYVKWGSRGVWGIVGETFIPVCMLLVLWSFFVCVAYFRHSDAAAIEGHLHVLLQGKENNA